MKKRIVYIITKGNIGGAQRYVLDLANAFKESCDVSVILGEGTHLRRELEKNGIRVHHVPSLVRDIGIRREWKSLASIRAILRREQPDIVHLNSSKIGVLGGLAARLERVPRIIFTAHGWAFNEERSFPARTAMYFLHWLTVMLSHATIANSKATKRDIAFLPFMKSRVQTITLGIKPFEFHERDKARELIGLQKDVFIAGTIAELHRNKGLDIALHALVRVPDVIFSIIGAGEKEAELKELAQTLGIGDRVLFLGAIQNAKQHLRAFDLFVLPSRTESLGYVLLEAGFARLPVIASRVGGIPEIIEHDVSGVLVPPEHARAIAEALARLAEDSSYRSALGANLGRIIDRDFTFSDMAKKTEALYRNSTS